MKTHHSRRPAGFTLVELLVVIAIIAVLAGAGFAAGNAAIQKAKRTTALATCTAIESAVNNFYTEYGSIPKENADENTPIKTDTDLDFLKVLLGQEGNSGTVLNNRSIKFLSVREGKAKKNGMMYDSTGKPTGLYDPWGGPYLVVLDSNYDEKLEVSTAAVSTKKTLNGRRVAVWSNGADAVKGTGGKAADDVLTW